MNLKGVAISLLEGVSETIITLEKSGEGVVSAADIITDHTVEIINPEHIIAHMTQSGSLKMQLKINAKIDAEKVVKFHEQCNKNDARIDPQIKYFLVFSKNANYVKTLVLL